MSRPFHLFASAGRRRSPDRCRSIGAERVTTAGSVFAKNWPFVDLDVVTGGCALILAPHPDDESLGCGGLIAESCMRDQPPVLVVLTDGTGSHPLSAAYPASRLRALRRAETRKAVACLGLPPRRLIFLDLVDREAPTQGPAFVATIAKLAKLMAVDEMSRPTTWVCGCRASSRTSCPLPQPGTRTLPAIWPLRR